jgi:glycosyltransferase involved in cell wall biosynthesis
LEPFSPYGKQADDFFGDFPKLFKTDKNNVMRQEPEKKTAVLIPCYNEAATIQKVVHDFQQALPAATIYVYDNDSVDDTANLAKQAGAVVGREPWRGKGNVVRRMFSDIEADIYLMVDGDDTCDATAAPEMIRRLIAERADMLVGVRKNLFHNAHRKYHGFGNRAFNFIFKQLIGRGFSDIFSGYRVFTRRFIKSFPSLSTGFEIETEISVHACLLKLPFLEMETQYRPRPVGSVSKLHTVRDSIRILRTIIYLFKEVRPALFFGSIAALLSLTSTILAIPIFETFIETGMVPRFPTAILSTGLMLLAGLSLGCGLILDSVAHGRLEQKRIFYLGIQVDESER